MKTAGVIDNGNSYTVGDVTIPKTSSGSIDYSNLPDDIDSSDLARLQLGLNNKIVSTGLKQSLAELQSYKDQVVRHSELAREEANNIYDTANNRLDEDKLQAKNALAYNTAKLEMERDSSLENILDQQAKMEGYQKGLMAAWGCEGSSAAISSMANIKNQYLKQYMNTKQGYDIELANLNNKMTEVSLAFTNRSIEIANAKALAVQGINNNLLDGIDKIFNETSKAYENADLKLMQNNLDYARLNAEIESQAINAQYEAEKDTRDYNFKLMKEFNDNKFAYNIDENGNVNLILDRNGQPIKANKASSLSGSSYGSSSLTSSSDYSSDIDETNIETRALLGKKGIAELSNFRFKPIKNTEGAINTSEFANISLQVLLKNPTASYEDLVEAEILPKNANSQSGFIQAKNKFKAQTNISTNPVYLWDNIKEDPYVQNILKGKIITDFDNNGNPALDEKGNPKVNKIPKAEIKPTIKNLLLEYGVAENTAQAFVNNEKNFTKSNISKAISGVKNLFDF
jgi:hypothetical protein